MRAEPGDGTQALKCEHRELCLYLEHKSESAPHYGLTSFLLSTRVSQGKFTCHDFPYWRTLDSIGSHLQMSQGKCKDGVSLLEKGRGSNVNADPSCTWTPSSGDRRGVLKPRHFSQPFLICLIHSLIFFQKKTPLLTCLNISKTTTFRAKKKKKKSSFSE